MWTATYNIIRAVALTALVTSLILALASSPAFIPIAMGVIVAGELASFVDMIWIARCYREGQDDLWQNRRLNPFVEHAWNVFPIAGLIMWIFASNVNPAFSGLGMFMWIARLVPWLLGGIISESVAGVPLKMTYGGWKVRR